MKEDNKICTGFKAKDGTYLKVGDKVKVPDNPDIAPYDIGVIEYRPNHGIRRIFDFESNTDFLFVGRLSITPLDFYVACGHEIEKI